MQDHEMSEPQLVNFTSLIAIRSLIARDSLAACQQFNLTQAQVSRIAALDAAEIHLLVANLSAASLFVPRSNFAALLSAPTVLVPILAGARFSTLASAGAPRRRSSDLIEQRIAT